MPNTYGHTHPNPDRAKLRAARELVEEFTGSKVTSRRGSTKRPDLRLFKTSNGARLIARFYASGVCLSPEAAPSRVVASRAYSNA